MLLRKVVNGGGRWAVHAELTDPSPEAIEEACQLHFPAGARPPGVEPPKPPTRKGSTEPAPAVHIPTDEEINSPMEFSIEDA